MEANNYSSIFDLLQQISDHSANASRGINLLSSYDDKFYELKSTISFNKDNSSYLLTRHREFDAENKSIPAEFYDKVYEFIYREFFLADHVKDYASGNTKKLLLEYFIGSATESDVQLTRKHLNPLLDVFTDYQKSLMRSNEIHNSCLIVTALPLEFRAIVRRFSLLTKINYFKNESENSLPSEKYPHESNPFIWAFRKEFDKSMEEDNPTSHVYERPTWLLAEGLICNNKKKAKINVILLPTVGPKCAKDAIKLCASQHLPYKEIIVCGIAATIDPNDKLRIGDVILSENIYGAWIDKAVVAEKKIEIVNRKPIMKYPINFNSNGWKPNLIEMVPQKVKNKGFKEVVNCDLISLPHLSKAVWFKKRINIMFPSCRALEMEALGCCDTSKKVRVIKSICDKGDHRKNKIWQPYCADVASAFTVDYVLNNYGIDLN